MTGKGHQQLSSMTRCFLLLAVCAIHQQRFSTEALSTITPTPTTTAKLVAPSPTPVTPPSKKTTDLKKPRACAGKAFQHEPPYLGLITHDDACDNEEHFQQTCATFQETLLHTDKKVDLVSVRVNPHTGKPALVQRLIEFLVSLDADVPITVCSEFTTAAVQAKAHGVHLRKEHCDYSEGSAKSITIPWIRQQYRQADDSEVQQQPPILGTTVHSVYAAMKAWQYHPDYYLVGCDRRSGHDMAGVIKTFLQGATPNPVVLAVSGDHVVDVARWCRSPIELGASGVVLPVPFHHQPHSDPKSDAQTVCDVWDAVQEAHKRGQESNFGVLE